MGHLICFCRSVDRTSRTAQITLLSDTSQTFGRVPQTLPPLESMKLNDQKVTNIVSKRDPKIETKSPNVSPNSLTTLDAQENIQQHEHNKVSCPSAMALINHCKYIFVRACHMFCGVSKEASKNVTKRSQEQGSNQPQSNENPKHEYFFELKLDNSLKMNTIIIIKGQLL